MFTPIKTKYSTLNSNLKHQVTKKMPQPTFLPDHRSKEVITIMLTVWMPQSSTIINSDNLLLRLLRPAWAKPMTSKTTYQTSKGEQLKTQTTSHMNLNHTGPDSDTGNRWKAQEWAEPSASPHPDTMELAVPSEWLESSAKKIFQIWATSSKWSVAHALDTFQEIHQFLQS